MDCLTLPSETLKGVIVAIDSFSRFVEAKSVESFPNLDVEAQSLRGKVPARSYSC